MLVLQIREMEKQAEHTLERAQRSQRATIREKYLSHGNNGSQKQKQGVGTGMIGHWIWMALAWASPTYLMGICSLVCEPQYEMQCKQRICTLYTHIDGGSYYHLNKAPLFQLTTTFILNRL